MQFNYAFEKVYQLLADVNVRALLLYMCVALLWHTDYPAGSEHSHWLTHLTVAPSGQFVHVDTTEHNLAKLNEFLQYFSVHYLSNWNYCYYNNKLTSLNFFLNLNIFREVPSYLSHNWSCSRTLPPGRNVKINYPSKIEGHVINIDMGAITITMVNLKFKL